MISLADAFWRPAAPLHVEDGLLINSSSVWGYAAVPLITHPVIDRQAVMNAVQQHVHLLNRAQTGTWHLAALPMPLAPTVPVVPLTGVTESGLWEPYQERTRQYLAQSEHRGRVVLLGRRLGGRREGGWRTVMRHAERAMGAEGTIPEDELEKWRHRRDRWINECRSQVPLMGPASAGTIRWSVWRCYWRGLEGTVINPPIDNEATAGDEAVSLINGVVRKSYGHVLLGDRGESLCSFLTLSHLPPGKSFEAGFDWLFAPEALGFPTEASVRFDLHPTSQARQETAAAERNAKQMQEHVLEIGQQPPDELDETIAVAKWERDRLDKTQGCHVHMHPRFAVWASTERELDEHRQDLMGKFEELDMRLEPARGDQMALWSECVPGDHVRVAWHKHQVPPETLCGSMYMGSNDLGDPVGPYLGVSIGSLTGTEAQNPRGKLPIFEDVFLPANAPITVSRKGAMLLTGETGGGKSNDLFKTGVEVGMRGATGVLTDPKGDADGLEDLELDNFQRLAITPQYAGLLNPFGLRGGDRQRLGVLAAEVLQRMLNPKLLDRGSYLIENAAIAESKLPHPRMEGVLGRIREVEKDDSVARQIVLNLEAVREMPQGRLLFADPETYSLQIEGKLTQVVIPDLQLPERGATDLSLRQRLSLGLMTALTAFLGDLIEFGDDWHPKWLGIDEAHLLLGSAELETVVERFERLGRSKFAVVELSTQSMRDVIGRGLMNHIGVIRSYRTDEDYEFQAAAQLFPGMTYELAKRWLSAAQPRQFLMRDRYGRVGRGIRDIVFPRMVEAFDTSPGGKARRQERKLAVPA